MINVDDCINHKCQFGTCVDGIGSYTCKCKEGFSGSFCDVMTPIALALKSTDEKHDIKNGIERIECNVNDCFNGGICYHQIIHGKTEESTKCKCKLGYSGEKCELLTRVNYDYDDSYIEFESPDFEYSFNLTLSIITESENGILFYHGSTNKKHMAIELFMGRLRVSYDIGNNVISTMFSKAKINDSNFLKNQRFYAKFDLFFYLFL